MNESQKQADWSIIVTLVASVFLIGSLVLYVVGYFTLANTAISADSTIRAYKKTWHADIFGPAARFEELSTERKTFILTTVTTTVSP